MSDLERYLRTDVKSVEGWLRPEAATLIARLARGQDARGAVAEIGVHHGKLFLLLSLARRPGEGAVAIDLFAHQELNVDHSGSGDLIKFERNLRRLDPAASSVQIHSRDSTTLTTDELLAFGSGGYRLFSVDGGHTAGITSSDLSISSSVLEPGGLLILDDYFNVSWPGVSEGANRFLTSQPPVVAFAAGHGKMFFTQQPHVDRYRRTIESVARDHNWRLTEQPFHGGPLMIVETRPRPSFAARSSRKLRSTAIGHTLTEPLVRALHARRR